MKRNVAWALAGNVVYAGCQWAMLVALAKLCSPETVGQFALGVAVTSPVVLLTGLQLRAALATDVTGTFSLEEYLGLRLIATAAGLATIAAVVVAAGYREETQWAVLAVGLGKAVESVSDLIYGVLQRNERMDLIARSMILRGAGTLLALGVTVQATGSVFWGALALAAVSLVLLVAYDMPAAARVIPASGRRGVPLGWQAAAAALRPTWRIAGLWRLARETLPLGFVMMLIGLNRNLPRYFVERSMGERELGIFAAIAYIQVAGSTVVDAVCQSASPRLAGHHAAGRVRQFRGALAKLAGLASLMGAVGVGAALLAGRQVLALLYGAEYAAESPVLIWLMAVAAVGYVGSVLGYGITATRRFALFPVPYLALTAVAAFCSAYAIPRWGLYGACATAGLVSLGSCVVPFLVLFQVREESKHVASPSFAA
ncbi:MAG TPA: lipopolysaccharide biosynthesis protein [Bryobacteraceae bacterium]|nr:lipopolysaccharide biosynthesis protein [Bryobacteraceae bacterium]